VLLIATDGTQVGIVPAEEALQRAREAGLDLVEVSPDSDPPVCRILDYGKFKYGSKRREPGPKSRKQHFGQIKEIRMRPKIDKHDLERKLTKARELLEEGYRLQITCLFRGREMRHMELGERLLVQASEMLADVSKLERRLDRDGRRMNLMLMPKIEVVRTKTKEREEQAKKHAADVEAHRKKSKRRDSVRRKPVRVDGGEPLSEEIEVPADQKAPEGESLSEESEEIEVSADQKAPEPETTEGADAQAKDAQGTEEKG